MKTSKKQFELFRDTFIKYQIMFGLKPGYEVYFTHDDTKDAYANISVDQDSKKVSVRFATDWLEDSVKKLNDKEIKKTALHECLHLLTSRLVWIARCRYVGEGEVPEEDHVIVTKLVSIISELEVKKK